MSTILSGRDGDAFIPPFSAASTNIWHRYWTPLSPKSENYAYVNARVRGRVSAFLNAEVYLNLANGTLRDMEQFMLQGRVAEFYRAQLISDEALPLRRIQAALMGQLNASLGSVRRLAQGEPLDLLAILLSDADMSNARYLLRGAVYGTSRTGSPLWRGYGMLPSFFYDHVWNTCTNLQEVCERCRENMHPVARTIASAFAGESGSPTIRRMERVLLSAFLKYRYALAEAFGSHNGEILRQYLLLLRDVWNVGIWFRRAGDIDIADLDIGDQLKDLNLSAAFLSLCADLRRRRPHTRQEWHYRLRFGVWEWLRNLFRVDPLGIEVLMGYTAMEFIEWHNLNVIASGLSFTMSPEYIYGRLIPVKGMQPVT